MKELRKGLCILLTILAVVAILPSVPAKALSESDVPANTSTPLTEVDADLTQYRQYVALRKVVNVYVNCYLTALGIGKGDYMGAAIIRSCVYVPNSKADDGYYHKLLVYDCEMHPATISSKKYIAAQALMAEVGFAPVNYCNATQTPSSTQLDVKVAKENTTTTTQSFEISPKFSKSLGSTTSAESKDTLEVSGKYSNSRTKTIGVTISYQTNGYTVTANKDNNFAYWRYNYQVWGDKNTDAWGQGTTLTSGVLDYRDTVNSSMTSKTINTYFDICFGAGYYQGKNEGKRIKNEGSDPVLGRYTSDKSGSKVLYFSY